jgi:hypothetical protein
VRLYREPSGPSQWRRLEFKDTKIQRYGLFIISSSLAGFEPCPARGLVPTGFEPRANLLRNPVRGLIPIDKPWSQRLKTGAIAAIGQPSQGRAEFFALP